MNFENKKTITIFFIAVLILVIIVFFVISFFISKDLLPHYTNLVLVVITMFYVYFTYLMLITSKTTNLPYIDTEIIVKKELTSEFIKEHGVYLREDDRFKIIENERESPTFNKNMVFLKIKNIGNAMALDVILSIEYRFNNRSDYRETKTKLNFGSIKKEKGYNMKLVDIYNNPDSQKDYFKLEKCVLNLNNIGNKQSGGNSYKIDILREIKPLIDEGVLIDFSKKES